METAFYDGKSRTFTFERFCELLVQAYNDLAETHEEVTEERKMKTFLKGLQAPRSESAKNTILVTPALTGSVADSMDMVAEILGDLKSFTNPAKRSISAISNARGGGIRGRRAGRPGRGRGTMGGRGERRLKDKEITNRYYSSHEWWNMMNEAQRTKARSLREGIRSNSVSMQNQARRETGPQGNRNMSSVEREQPESQNNTQANTNEDASTNGQNLYSVSSRSHIE